MSSTPSLDRRWDLLLASLAGFILVAVGRVHQLFPVLLPLKLAQVTGVVAILLYLLAARGVRRVNTIWDRPSVYLLALLLWVALSVPGASWQGAAFATLVDFGKTVLVCLVLVASVRGVRDVERLALIYFGAAVTFSVVVLARFQLGDEGRLARLYYYDANDFATFVVTALPLGLYFAMHPRSRLWRVVAWLALVPLVVGFIWSGSRGGFLALLAVLAFFLVRYTAVPRRWRIAGVLVLGLVMAATASGTYWERMRTILHPEQDYNRTSEQGRWRIWRRGIGYMMAYPVLGVGAGNFPTAEGTLSPLAALAERGMGVKWSSPHNTYVQIGAELGVPGLLIFLGFLAALFRVLRVVLRTGGGADGRARAPPQLAQSLMASLLGFAVGCFFLTLAYQAMLYTLAALAMALRKVSVGAVPVRSLGPAWSRGGAAPAGLPRRQVPTRMPPLGGVGPLTREGERA